MAGKLRKLYEWFRDSQTPRGVRELRAQRAARTAQVADRQRLAQPHYYVFRYRGDQVRGDRVLPESESGWRYPKQYFGPFETQAEAKAALRVELARYGLPRRQYKTRRLTADQFEQVWGSLPGEAGEGY